MYDYAYLTGAGGGAPEVTGCEPACQVTRSRVHVRITLITDYMDLGVQATADRDTFLTGGGDNPSRFGGCTCYMKID